MTEFKRDKINKVRKAVRGHYDKETVHRIVDCGLMAHVGFTGEHGPVVLPMIYARKDDALYLHGAKATRFVKFLSKGVEACATITHLDAIVVGRSAFNSSMNYRSVMLHGTAYEVTERREKEEALVLVTDHLLPGRWEEARPMTEKEMTSTGVIRLDIDYAAAKIRDGGVIDEEEDYDLPIWAGVIPVSMNLEEAIPDNRLINDVEEAASIDKAHQKFST